MNKRHMQNELKRQIRKSQKALSHFAAALEAIDEFTLEDIKLMEEVIVGLNDPQKPISRTATALLIAMQQSRPVLIQPRYRPLMNGLGHCVSAFRVYIETKNAQEPEDKPPIIFKANGKKLNPTDN